MEKIPSTEEYLKPKNWKERRFTNPEDQFVARNKEENLEAFEDSKKGIKEQVNNHLKGEKFIDFEHALGVGIYEKMNFVYDFVIEYFHEKGFTNIKTLPKVYLINKPEEKGSINFGARTELGITINNAAFEKIEHESLRQIEFLNVLNHELYHATSSISIDVDKYTFPTVVNYGVSYLEEGIGHEMAFEEGLAYKFQYSESIKIKSLFSENEVSLYETLIDTAISNTKNERNHQLEGTQLFDFKVNSKDENGIANVSYSTKADPGNDFSIKLVKYLDSKIENFDFVVEKARVNRQTLDLVRSVEEKFGEGSYRLITTAKVEEAEDVLKELMSREKISL